jgi:hypothetical protein
MGGMSEHDDLRDKIVEAATDAGFQVMSDVELAAFMESGERATLERDDDARAEGRRFLDEERDQDVIAGWYAEAERVTLATLPTFVQGLTKAYRHDYGTICHAIAAAAVAAAHAVDHAPEGGITGFQAGAVMWEFVRHWDHATGPMRLVKYENLLYPQYAEHFALTISTSTWEWLQEEARKKLAASGKASSDVSAHWQSIVDGRVPFGLIVVSP